MTILEKLRLKGELDKLPTVVWLLLLAKIVGEMKRRR